MKATYRIVLLAMVAMVTGFVSCSDDDLGPSIFDTTEYPLDRTAITFPLDTFVKANFLDPYNVRFIYKMEDVGSDMAKNLTPASYEKSVKLATLSKYLWYDVYEKYAGVEFLKENSPRIIHVIGSKSYNPTQGTETLGVAEGGIKITLYGADELDENNIDYMNKYFFHTMHHEFGHILDQTKLHPSAFNLISSGHYNAMGWSDVPDSVSNGLGFVTSYASSAYSEDLVEVSSTYITADTLKWIDMLNTASYEWEYIDTEYGSEFEFYNAQETPFNIDTVGYFKQTDNGDCKIYRKACKRDADDHVVLDEEGNIQWLHDSGINGRDIILEKLELVRKWFNDSFGFSIDDVRREVQQRQYLTDADGNFVYKNGKLINRLSRKVEGDEQGRTLMEVLNEEVYKFKELMK
ncbi:MAG: putative zinc-binding metallopeptidase [Bacteroidaceae bacterium]|nr:putative zinc-binding metallopeptidase [Bacteroidaceae bacterium]